MKSIKTSQISLFARLIIEYGLFQLSKSGKDAPEKKQRASRKCSVCDKTLTKGNYISGNGGSTLICKNCFAKLL
jgi:hypothetical protein